MKILKMTVVLKTCYTMFTSYKISITSNFSVSVSNEKLKFKNTKMPKIKCLFMTLLKHTQSIGKMTKLWQKNSRSKTIEIPCV